MFTGLVEEVGTMTGIRRQGEAMSLSIAAKYIMAGVQLGDSIAVNGVCLTVTHFTKEQFTVDVIPQTYRNSNLKNLKSGSKVNLERAMLAGARFGGHIVQGHVDGIGVITGLQRDGNAYVYEIKPNTRDIFKFLLPKGSITVDGISLTVSDVGEDKFTISIIPHTRAETVLQYKAVGDTVNLESDIIGKYVAHLLHFKDSSVAEREGKVNESFLMEHGFV